jgi:ribosomal protein L37E
MSTCVDCGNEQPVVGRARCYTCGFNHDEREAVIEARNNEWWTNETGEVTC